MKVRKEPIAAKILLHYTLNLALLMLDPPARRAAQKITPILRWAV